MEIKELYLKDFKCFEEFKIQFTRPINLIFGENTSGKSSIVQAISLALTGKMGNGCERRSLVRHKAEDFAVTVSLSQNGIPDHPKQYEITQYTSIRESTDPETIFQGLKTNRETLAAIMDTANFLNLHPDEKKRILFDLLPDLKIDANNIACHLTTWLKDKPEIMKKYNIDLGEDLMEVLSSPTSLEDAYNQVYEERRIAKRELKTLGECPKLPKGLTREKLETDLNQKRQELSYLHVAIGETKGMAQGERRQIERELSQVTEELNQIETLLQDANNERLSKQLEALKDQHSVIAEEIQTLRDNYASLQRETGRLLAQKEQEEKSKSKAKNFAGHCPLFPDLTCKTKEVLSRMSTTIPDNTELSAAIEAQTKKTSDTARLLKEKEDALKQINNSGNIIKDNLSHIAGSRKKYQYLQEKKQKLEKILSTVSTDKATESQKLKEKITILESEIREETNLFTLLEKAEAFQALEKRINKLEVLTLAFSPKGIMSNLMKGAASSLMRLANSLMADLTNNRYAIEINLEEGFQIFLCNCQTGALTDINIVSTSERFRVGIVMQAVLSELTGLRFMVIDGIDILDQANRGFFFHFLRKVLPRFDQIIGLGTIGQVTPKNPGLAEVDFFLLKDGQIRQIAA